MRRTVLGSAGIVLVATLAASSQSQRRTVEPAGVRGYILSPDGIPVSEGTATLIGAGPDLVAEISRAGLFQIDRAVAGTHELRVSVQGFMVYHLRVTLSSASMLLLPPRRLSPECYLRLRLRSPTGEPLTSARILRQVFDASGSPVAERYPPERPDVVAPDGTMTLGPLPRGLVALLVDAPPFARMRLPDVRITGEAPLVDAGTLTVEPGAVLAVRLVDEAGQPVPNHEVDVDDGKPRLAWTSRGPTDEEGIARFERLASGQYTIRTLGVRRCARGTPLVERRVRVASGARIQQRMVIGGRPWVLRLSSGGAPLAGVTVAIAPQSTIVERRAGMRGRSGGAGRDPVMSDVEGPCTATTAADGRAAIMDVPPGPARLVLRFPNSSWSRWIEVPASREEVALAVPTGVVALRVVGADSGTPVRADVAWTSGGGRVTASASATGDVLLDAVPDGPGTLRVRSPGHRPLDRNLVAPPDTPYELALERLPEPSLRCRVVNDTGDAVEAAVVELTPGDPIEDGHVAMTDASGMVRFEHVPEGTAQLVASAAGFVPAAASARIPPPSRDAVITLVVRTAERREARPRTP